MKMITLIFYLIAMVRSTYSIKRVLKFDIIKKSFATIPELPLFMVANTSDKGLSNQLWGQEIKFVKYEEVNLLIWLENSKKLIGYYGDIWTTLAEWNNFTLRPVTRQTALSQSTAKYGHDHLVDLVQNKEAQLIPSINIIENIPKIKYTLPFMTIRFNFYIRQTTKYDKTWIDIFSSYCWCMILCTLLALIISGYVYQKAIARVYKWNDELTFFDYFFHVLSQACLQGWAESKLVSRSRVISVISSVFFWIIHTTIGSLSISFLMNVNNSPPFENLRSLIDSNYLVLFSKDTDSYETFKNIISQANYKKMKHRVRFEKTLKDVYTKMCSLSKNYVLFETTDNFQATADLQVCTLVAIDISHARTWSASGVFHTFKYKRVLDYGILRMMETGILNRIYRHWLYNPSKGIKTFYAPITFEQVHLTVNIYVFAVLASILILVAEMIIFNLKKYDVKHFLKTKKYR